MGPGGARGTWAGEEGGSLRALWPWSSARLPVCRVPEETGGRVEGGRHGTAASPPPSLAGHSVPTTPRLGALCFATLPRGAAHLHIPTPPPWRLPAAPPAIHHALPRRLTPFLRQNTPRRGNWCPLGVRRHPQLATKHISADGWHRREVSPGPPPPPRGRHLVWGPFPQGGSST